MAFATEVSLDGATIWTENNYWPLLVGFLIAGALIALAASSYVGSPLFAPSSLTVNQTQLHSSPAPLTASKSGTSTTTGTTGTTGTAGSGITPRFEGMVSAQSAASAFDNVSR